MTLPLGRRAARVLAVVLACAAALVGGAGSAAAHAQLLSSAPAAGARADRSPQTVSLSFSESVSISTDSLTLLDATHKRLATGVPSHPRGDGAEVSVTIPRALPKGAYVVLWHVISDDGHPVSGTFSFGVGVQPPPTEPGLAASPSAAGTSARWVAGALAVGGIVVLGGAVAFLLLLWPDGVRLVPVRRLLMTAWLAALAGSAMGVTVSSTLGTTASRLALLRIVVLAAAAITWWRARRHDTLPGRFDAAALWFLVAETFSFSGHPGHGPAPLFMTTVDVVHLSAASAWLGGLVALLVALRAHDGGVVVPPTLVRRWSAMAGWAVGALVVTGAASAVVQVGSLGALLATAYGRLVLTKVALLGAVLLVALGSRRLVRRAAGDVREPAYQRLRRSVVAESGALAAVLAVTAALLMSTPAREAYLPSFSTVVGVRDGTGRDLRVDVRIRPPAVGYEGITARVTDVTGTNVPVTRASLTLDNAAAGVGPLTYPLAVVGGSVEDILISAPAPGPWHAELRLVVPGGPVTASFDYDAG